MTILFLGKLVAISPEISQGRVQGKVRFSDQSPANLRQNQRLTTRIILEQKQNVAYLPRGQYLQKNGQYLYIVRDGEAIKTPVKLGSIGLTKVEIISGLAVNDQVVVSNMNVFKEAPSVRVIQ